MSLSHSVFIFPRVTMPRLAKICAKCSASVNVKKTVCECGYNFALKPKASIDATRKSKRIAMRCQRALESLSMTISRRELNRVNMYKRRALESPSEIMARHEQDKEYTAKKRALESPSERIARLEQVRAYISKKEH